MARRNRKSSGLALQVPKSGYGFLKAVLDCLSYYAEELTTKLDSPHQSGGNPGYPARQMVRLHVLKYLLNERFANKFLNSEKPEGTRLRIMGILHRSSPEWKTLFKTRPSIERGFGSSKHSRLLDKHQYLGQGRVSLHAKMSNLSYLLTAWGRLRAGGYAYMRHMHIKLPSLPSPVSELREMHECAECCLCPQHNRLAA